MLSAEEWSRGPALALLVCLGFIACGEPLAPHSPQEFYNLAKAQLAKNQYRAAADSLQSAAQADPTGETGREAMVLRMALLAGMAGGFQHVAEEHLAGYKQTRAEPLRTVAMDYFNRARGRSFEMVDELERVLKLPTASPFHVDYRPATAPTPAADRPSRPLSSQITRA